MNEHRPRVEEIGPGKEMFVCAECDQEWPCDTEQDLSREEPHPGSPLEPVQ